MNALNTMVALMQRLEQSTVQSGLGIPTILGSPEFGRPEVELPIAAILFAEYDYALPPQRRLGQTQPAGQSLRGALHIFASNERQLLSLVDTLYATKTVVAGLAVDGQVVKVVFGGTRRADYGSDERQLAHATITDFVCSQY